MHVLVTTDGSRRSLNALPHAIRLARAIGADLRLLRVLDPSVDLGKVRAPDLDEAIEAVRERWTAEMEAHLAGFEGDARALVEVKARGEDAAAAIVRAATDSHASMIAMATQGAGFVRAALLGSVATGVLNTSPVPLMLVGGRVRPADDSDSYHLLMTTDGSDEAQSTLSASKRLLANASRERLRITLLFVYRAALGDPPRSMALEESRRLLAVFRRRAPRRFPMESVVHEQTGMGGADRAIRRVAQERQVDAIWMTSHGQSFRRRVLLGSVTLSTVKDAYVPVVVTRSE